MLNGPVEWVEEFDLAGIHLPAVALMAMQQRPLGRDFRVAASCHNPDELRQAVLIGVDWACLSPVKTTVSHPGAPVLGIDRFRSWVGACQLPVYGLGGLGLHDLPEIRAAGGQGVAGISAFWD